MRLSWGPCPALKLETMGATALLGTPSRNFWNRSVIPGDTADSASAAASPDIRGKSLAHSALRVPGVISIIGWLGAWIPEAGSALRFGQALQWG